METLKELHLVADEMETLTIEDFIFEAVEEKVEDEALAESDI